MTNIHWECLWSITSPGAVLQQLGIMDANKRHCDLSLRRFTPHMAMQFKTKDGWWMWKEALAMKLKPLALSEYSGSFKLKNVPGDLRWWYCWCLSSGLLGIGSGVLKVLAMDSCMKVPFGLVPSATSIGVTAALGCIYPTRIYRARNAFQLWCVIGAMSDKLWSVLMR